MQSPIRHPLLVGGVSGSGKSTVAGAWAQRAAAGLIEGDLYHSEASIAKMRAGIALEDADRIGWLDRLVAAAQQHVGTAAPVVSCSALRRRYRDRLRLGIPGLRLVILDVPYAVAVARVGARAGHYMPPALVASQFDALERPVDEPRTVLMDGCRPVPEILDAIDDWLRHS